MTLRSQQQQRSLANISQKIWLATKTFLPLLLLKRRTNSGVGAYFDLITDDGRRFYGDDFHFGYFPTGTEDLNAGLNALTDLVAQAAELDNTEHFLDIGCGVGAAAIRIAENYQGKITGINLSSRQVLQAKELVEQNQLAHRITIQKGNALQLDFADQSFDTLLCLEVAGDICVSDEQKALFIKELHRVLRPGGTIGFADLVFLATPTKKEDKSVQAVLYHTGTELITDWPALFQQEGFVIENHQDIILQTMKTWEYTLAVYEERYDEVNGYFGKRIATGIRNHLRLIPDILKKYGAYPVFLAKKHF